MSDKSHRAPVSRLGVAPTYLRRGPLAPLAALVVLAGLAAGCVVTVDTGQYSAREEKRFTVTGIPDVNLTTFDGSIEVRAWDRQEVYVEIEKRAADETWLQKLEVKTEQVANRITIEVRQPTGQSRLFHVGSSPSARLIAAVPRQTNLVARSGDGAISLERISGQLDIETEDGSIRGSDLKGDVRAHTGDGSIRLDGTDGRFDLDSGDGGVALAGRLASVRIRTDDGVVSVRAEDGSTMAEGWEIRSGDGGVTIELPEAFDANLDASCSDGSVRVDRLRLSASGTSRRQVKGQIGAGGPLLTVRTADGSILVRNR
jgi:DUF4097 and DUF4098 domain-containing protein YvlB